jgi:hypothetical protein
MVAPQCPRPEVRNLDPRSWADLHKTLRDRLWTARIHALREGLRLELNSGGRSDGQQWDFRRSRCPGRECNRACKGNPQTALPGRSNHRNLSYEISAADMMGTGLAYLHRNKARFGIHFPVPGEAWHAENYGTPTVQIIEWPNLAPAPAPSPNVGRPYKQFKANVTDASVFAAGGRDNQISELQWLLKDLGFFRGNITGGYYDQTVKAVQAYKQAANWRDRNGKRDTSSVVSAVLVDTLKAYVALKAGK